MRLQLAALLVPAVSLLASPLARQAAAQELEAGEGDATSRILIYSDDDATTVTTAAVDGQAGVQRGMVIGVHALVDAVSTASVDVVSAATERWDETRVELGARASALVTGTTVSIGYIRSQENDWLSNAVSVSGSKELFQRNTVVSASYSLVLNKVGRAEDPTFEKSLDGHSVALSISQLVDRKTRVGASYTGQYLSGFMSSPYRYVSAIDGSRGPERHPDSRVRHALSGFAVRSLAPFLSARGSYRLYLDDWGVRSHTGTVALASDFGGRWSAGVEGRVYLQNQANFYRRTYPTVLRHMTNDRELSSFWDVGGSGRLGVRVGPVDADAKVGMIHYRFRNFLALPRRTALIASGGIKVAW